MSTSEIESLKRHFEAQMAKYEKSHLEAIKQVEEQRTNDMKDIMAVLKPIADTYNTANTAARWVKKLLIFAGIVVSLIVSIKKLSV